MTCSRMKFPTVNPRTSQNAPGGTPRRGRGRAVPVASLATFLLVACLAASGCSDLGPSNANAAVHTSRVTGLKVRYSPLGDYTVGVPKGWTPQPFGRDSIRLTQNGGPGIITLLGGVPVSILGAAEAETQCEQQLDNSPLTAQSPISCAQQAYQDLLQGYSQPITVQQALPAILQAAAGQGVSIGQPQIIQRSPDTATFTVRLSASGQLLNAQGAIDVVSVNASPLPGTDWTTEALLGYCLAPPGQSAGLASVCARVLGSFRTNKYFWPYAMEFLVNGLEQAAQGVGGLAESDLAGFAQSEQIINQWAGSMQQVQDQTYEFIRSQDLENGQKAIATLGGDTLVHNPTDGEEYPVPYGYESYCLDVSGTRAIYGDGVIPGVDGCQTMLQLDS
jgi:hypothetical protein